MTAPRVTFLRHAQSTFNACGVRERDPPLTALGQAEACNLTFPAVDAIVCSTLRRARQTLACLQQRECLTNVTVFTDLCREVRDGNPVNLLPHEPECALLETPQGLTIRLQSFWQLVRRLAGPQGHVLVISHHDFIWRATNVALPNCGMTTVQLDIVKL